MKFFERKSKFYKELKARLKDNHFQLGREIEPDVYEVINGAMSFNFDVKAAKREYEQTKSTVLMDKLIKNLELDFAAKYKLAVFHNAQRFLRAMIMREEDVNESYIYNDFVDNLKQVIAFTTDDKKAYPLNAAYLKKWGVPKDVVFSVADKNMCDLFRKSELRVSTIAGEIKVVEFEGLYEELSASLMLCSDFKNAVSQKLGSRFLVVAPSAETLLAVEDVTNDVIEIFGPLVVEEYKKAKTKLSTNVYLFSQTGISVAGRFQCD
ncbi:MAG: hypothetical protein ACI4KH_08070 [Oscillospiraceae bacterium]